MQAECAVTHELLAMRFALRSRCSVCGVNLALDLFDFVHGSGHVDQAFDYYV